MEVASYIGLFDELEKMAEAIRGAEDGRKPATWKKYKRHLGTAAVLAAGGGLGYATGRQVHKVLLRNRGRIGDFISKYPKSAPLAIKALATGAAGMGAYKTKKTLEKIEGNDGPK